MQEYQLQAKLSQCKCCLRGCEDELDDIVILDARNVTRREVQAALSNVHGEDILCKSVRREKSGSKHREKHFVGEGCNRFEKNLQGKLGEFGCRLADENDVQTPYVWQTVVRGWPDEMERDARSVKKCLASGTGNQ